MNEISCDRCGELVDCRYIMTKQAGVWIERVDGERALLGDLHCCYACCDALEAESVEQAHRFVFVP